MYPLFGGGMAMPTKVENFETHRQPVPTRAIKKSKNMPICATMKHTMKRHWASLDTWFVLNEVRT
jgi:hypothetical protein